MKLYCTQCGKHLYNREVDFGVAEIVSPVGLTLPDGRAAEHRERLAWCGCPDPAKGIPSLTVIGPGDENELLPNDYKARLASL